MLEERKEVKRVEKSDSNTFREINNSTLQLSNPIRIELSAEQLFRSIGSNHLQHDDIDKDYPIFLIYDGYFYITYWLDIGQNNHHIANYINKWMSLLMYSSEDFTIKEIPPTPFHEGLLIQFYTEKNIDSYHIKCKEKINLIEVISVELPEQKNMHDFFMYLHSNIWKDYWGFFCFIHYKNSIEKLQSQVRTYYNMLITCSIEYQLLDLHSIVKQQKIKRDMRNLIVSLFSFYAEYSLAYSYYQTEKGLCRKPTPYFILT